MAGGDQQTIVRDAARLILDGDARAALALLGRAAVPDAAIHDLAAEAQARLGDLRAAIASRRAALSLSPDPHRRAALARALLVASATAEARAEAEAALAEGGAAILEARQVLGLLALVEGRPADAVAQLRKLAADAPGNGEIRENLAKALWALGDLAGAEDSLRQALRLKPGLDVAAGTLALLLLAQGRFAEGWDLYRRRTVPGRAAPPVRRLPADLTARTLFVEGEQGLGDEIFLLRFARVAAERGARVVVRCAPRLAGLIGRLPFVARVAGPDEAAEGDFVAWAGDLPWLLGAEAILPPVALEPLAERVESLRRRLAEFGPPPYVGVTWRAGVQRVGHLSKAVPPEALGRFLAPVPARVVILQRQPAAGEAEAFTAGLGRPALDLSALNDDLEDMLALLSLLDQQVAVSNTNIHLAAGLGGRARILLPFPAEFRWMEGAAASPWFPDMVLYRQDAAGGWRWALDALAADLGGGRAADPRLVQAAAASRAGDHAQAEALCRRMLAEGGDAVAILPLFASSLLALGRLPEAVPALAQLAELAPSAENRTFLARALLALGQPAAAIEPLRRAVQAAPDPARHEMLAAALLEAGRYDEALEAADLAPAAPGARATRGAALHLMGRSDEAASCLRRLLDDNPANPRALNSLAQACHALGDFDGAERAWAECLRLDPGNQAGRASLAMMLLGRMRLDEGWDLYRWRHTARGRPGIPSRRLPDRLDGLHVLVVGEQGLGDELFFLRWVERLKARGPRITYVANPKLIPLLRRLSFLDAVADGNDTIAADLAVWPGDLPWLLGESGPLPPVRLEPLPERVADMRARLEAFGSPPYLGLTWRAGIAGFNKLSKQVPPDGLAGALAGWGGSLVVLQRGPAAAEMAALGRPALDLSAVNEDLDAMLALLSVLDEVVAVSNTNIHLRAALGLGARILLPHPPEFRWTDAGNASPWMPGCLLYRCAQNGDWAPALVNLAADLARSRN